MAQRSLVPKGSSRTLNGLYATGKFESGSSLQRAHSPVKPANKNGAQYALGADHRAGPLDLRNVSGLLTGRRQAEMRTDVP